MILDYGMVEMWLQNGCKESDEQLINILKKLNRQLIAFVSVLHLIEALLQYIFGNSGGWYVS